MFVKFSFYMVLLVFVVSCQPKTKVERYLGLHGVQFEHCEDLIIVVNAQACLYCNSKVFTELNHIAKRHHLKILTNDSQALESIFNKSLLYEDKEMSWPQNGIDIPALGYIYRTKEQIKIDLIENETFYKFLETVRALDDSCRIYLAD